MDIIIYIVMNISMDVKERRRPDGGAAPGKVDGAARPVCIVDAIDEKKVTADMAFAVARP